MATGGNRTLYGPDSGPIGPGPLGEQLIVNGAFHVQGDVRPDDYVVRVELTSINGSPVNPISDEFEFQVTR